jgi:hypothetical protein
VLGRWPRLERHRPGIVYRAIVLGYYPTNPSVPVPYGEDGSKSADPKNDRFSRDVTTSLSIALVELDSIATILDEETPANKQRSLVRKFNSKPGFLFEYIDNKPCPHFKSLCQLIPERASAIGKIDRLRRLTQLGSGESGLVP